MGVSNENENSTGSEYTCLGSQPMKMKRSKWLSGAQKITAALNLLLGTVAIITYCALDVPLEADGGKIRSTALTIGLLSLTAFVIHLAGMNRRNASNIEKSTYFSLILINAVVLLLLKTSLADIEKETNSNVKRQFQTYYASGDSQTAVDAYHNKYKCCGFVNNNADFPDYRKFPKSCCSEATIEGEGSCNRNEAYPKTCKNKIVNAAKTYFLLIAGLCLTSAVSMVVLNLLLLNAFIKNCKELYQESRPKNE